MVRLSTLFVAAGAIAATSAVAVAVPRGVATTARAKHHQSKHPSCLSFFSAGSIQSITGIPTTLYGKSVFPLTHANYWRVSGPGVVPEQGDIPGSLCNFIDTSLPAGYPPSGPSGLTLNTAYVVVGYGESQKNWRRLRALFKSDALVFDTWTAPWSPLHVGGAAGAFLNTFAIADYYQATPAEFPAFPTYLYVVTVMTKRHNLLQVAFLSASLAKTTSVVTNLLKRDRNFF